MFKQAAMRRKIPYGVASIYICRWLLLHILYAVSCIDVDETWNVYFNLCDKIISIYNFIS